MINGLRIKWGKIDNWIKRTMLVIGFIGALTPIYFGIRDIVKSNILWYFDTTEELIEQWQVSMGVFESLLERVTGDFYVVFDDGVNRDAMIFKANYGDYFVFINDPILGTIVFSAYYNEPRSTWYFYSFGDNPYTIVYSK